MKQKSPSRLAGSLIAITITTILGQGSVAIAQPHVDSKHFDIDDQPLATALNEFARQSDRQILFSTEVVDAKRTKGVKGELDPEAALRQLLKGTGLTYRLTADNTILVEAPEARDTATVRGPEKLIRLAQADQAAQSQTESPENSANPENQASGQQPPKTDAVEEVVVVTGTHIPGGGGGASPVRIYSKDDIELTGLGSVHEFVQRLPQNFNGGASENTIAGVTGGAGNVNNTVSGTGVNLRGLGNAATLVLLNGNRVAPGNITGDFVDISMIPMSAIERIEVVPDGASAIYGADAVSGVVNFILRKDFEGAETRASYGSVTEGSHHQFSASQTFGRRWAGGSALLSYDYFDQTPLSAADRSFTDKVPLPFTLLPRQVRNSALLSLTQDVGSTAALFADATYSHRTTSTYINNAPVYAIHSPATISSYSGTLGGRFELPSQVRLELKAGYSSSKTDFEQIYHVGALTFPGADIKSAYDIMTVETSANGSLWAASAGDVKFAVGGLFRSEDFEYDNFLSPFRSFSPSRSITGAFVELQFPIVGPGPNGGPAERLVLTVADRYEHYDDFGSTNNPKAGFVWRPNADLKVRGTFSTSFRAPLLNQLNPLPGQVFPIGVPDPDGGTQPCSPPNTGNTCTNVLLNVGGGNPNLRPEKARGWTAGIDFNPAGLPGLEAGLTYYRIVFRDLIEFPATLGGFSNSRILELEGLFGSHIVQRNPSSEAITQLVTNNPSFINPFNIDPYSVGALFYGAANNLSIATTEGLDFAVRYAANLGQANVSAGLDGTYLTKLDKKFVAAAPTVSALNTPYNPIDLRVRAQASVTRGDATIALFLNYIDDYKDSRWATPLTVSSWTTIDMTARYDLSGLSGLGEGASLMLAVTNLADRPPPFVSNSGSFAGINYDGANADARGRFIRLQMTARF